MLSSNVCITYFIVIVPIAMSIIPTLPHPNHKSGLKLPVHSSQKFICNLHKRDSFIAHYPLLLHLWCQVFIVFCFIFIFYFFLSYLIYFSFISFISILLSRSGNPEINHLSFGHMANIRIIKVHTFWSRLHPVAKHRLPSDISSSSASTLSPFSLSIMDSFSLATVRIMFMQRSIGTLPSHVSLINNLTITTTFFVSISYMCMNIALTFTVMNPVIVCYVLNKNWPSATC